MTDEKKPKKVVDVVVEPVPAEPTAKSANSDEFKVHNNDVVEIPEDFDLDQLLPVPKAENLPSVSTKDRDPLSIYMQEILQIFFYI